MAIQYVDQNADLIGTVAQNYNISAANDQLQITIDGGTTANITLTHGAARTAAQVAADINAVLTGGTAYAPTYGPQAGMVRIRSTSSNGASSTILIGTPGSNANTILGLAAGTTTGFVRQKYSWTATLGTIQELINQIETYLLAAGWTTISGHGTGTLLMQSALTPPGQDLQMRVTIKTNSGTCVDISIQNVSGGLASTNSTTAGFPLLPAVGKTWIFVLNKYQAFIYTPIPTAVKGYAAFGVPMIPSFLQGAVVEAMWGSSNAGSEAASAIGASWRNFLWLYGYNSTAANQAGIVNGNLMQQNSTSAYNVGLLSLAWMGGVQVQGSWLQSWHDSSSFIFDAIVAWGVNATTMALYRGYLWDACVVNQAYAGDTATTFDSHNWVVVTDNQSGFFNSVVCTNGPGALLLVTP